jgi:putative addiction module killer protein
MNVGATTLTIREYVTPQGASPFRAWLGRLDTPLRARLQARVLRFETGNLGDHRAVGRGVWEARCHFGPGYRIYFARPGSTLILLLVGGDKTSQRDDIRRARNYWTDYQEATSHGTPK